MTKGKAPLPQSTLPFEIIDPQEPGARRPRVQYRNWHPVVAALVEGHTIFIPLDELPYSDIKYLTLVFYRRGYGEKVRSRTETRGGREGRAVWLEIGGQAHRHPPVPKMGEADAAG